MPSAAGVRTSRAGPPLYGDVGALAKALIAAAPERMVWASNWPHPTALDDPPDDAVLLDLLHEWTKDEALRRRILTDNPAALYGFDLDALAPLGVEDISMPATPAKVWQAIQNA